MYAEGRLLLYGSEGMGNWQRDEMIDDWSYWSNYVIGYRSNNNDDDHNVNNEGSLPHSSNSDKKGENIKIAIAPHGRISWMEDRKKARALAREGSFYLAKQQYQYTLRKYGSLKERSIHDMHIELGQLLVIIGEPEQALLSFQEALSFQPESHMAHYHLGMLATRVGSFEDAIKHYKNALFYDSNHCQTLHNLGSLLFLSLQFEEAEYYFLNAIDKHACASKYDKRNKDAEYNKTKVKMDGVPLALLTRKLLDHFLGAFVAKIQELDPFTNFHLERFYRNLNDDDRNLVAANILIHSGEAMYRQGLVEESINMWKSALDIQNGDTGGLRLQVAIAVPLYLTTSSHSVDIYHDTMDSLNEMLSHFNDEKGGRNRGAGHTKHVSSNEIYIPYPEMRCRISTVLTSLEFHFSAKSLMNQNTVLNVNHVNGEETVNQYRNIAEKIVQLIRRTTPSMNFISDHLINWHGKKQKRIRSNTNQYIKSLRKMKQNNVVALPLPKTKIGFVSGRFHSNSTELRMVYRFITETSFQFGDNSDNSGNELKHYHTTLITSGYNKKYETDQAHMELRQAVDRVLFLSPNVTNARETLNEYAVDILIFIAPTKDDQIYWLCYGRYAPIQIVYGAGGGTTGLHNTIDYFLVSDKMTNINVYEQYSEQVIRKSIIIITCCMHFSPYQ